MNHRIGAETLPMAGAAGTLGTRAWRFDSFEFDLRRGELHRYPDRAAIALRPKAESLLRQFLAQPGRLISHHRRRPQRCERIRALDPEGSTGLMMWGNVQMMRGRADLALPAFEKASLLVPS